MSDISPVVPSGAYIEAPITTDAATIQQNALAAIAALFPGWVPREGHLTVAIIEQMAQMTSETAVVAAMFPLLAFQYYGQLLNVTPEDGAAASAQTTWTMVDTKGYTVPAGTVVAYQTSGNVQVQFQTVADFTVPPGQQSTAAGAVEIQAQAVGAVNNGISDSTPIVPVQQIAFVSSIAATTTTSGGADPETLTAYLNRLSSTLQLLAPRPILPGDFAAMASSAVDTNGNSLGVFRALAINNLNPGRTIAGTITLTAASDVLEDTAGSFTVNDVGKTVTDTAGSIPANTTISSFTDANHVVMSANASTTEAADTVTLGDLTGQARCVTVAAVDSSGNALTPEVESELAAFFEARRETNFLVFVIGPTQTAIDATWTAYALAGYDTSTVQANGNAALEAFLNPGTWGGGAQTPPVWQVGYDIVRYNAALAALANAEGIDLSQPLTLTIGIHGDALGTADITLSGDAPLPTPGTISGAVSG